MTRTLFPMIRLLDDLCFFAKQAHNLFGRFGWFAFDDATGRALWGGRTSTTSSLAPAAPTSPASKPTSATVHWVNGFLRAWRMPRKEG